jgi:predicted MFS family arabinose efflux permease
LAVGLGNAALFAVFLFLTNYLQQVLGYSPVKTGLAFLPLPLSIGVAAMISQNALLPRLSTRTIMASGLTCSAIGAALLTRAGVTTNFAEWVLPGLVLIGAGIGLALVVATAMGSLPDTPEDAGTGSLNDTERTVRCWRVAPASSAP